ncbi:hypothetical protein ACLIMP_03865 [Novosphingobium aerophilum]|uniref:hypothetical protein n=1 Tax=Novosphingobium aerophilum TaxID=2839843 RepID=UPI003FD63B1B
MSNPIAVPAGYAPAFAIGFSDEAGAFATVRNTSPLPVSVAAGDPLLVRNVAAAAANALSGSTSQSIVAGPFVPALSRPVVLALSGTWSGTVSLRRSTDAGATRNAVTVAGTPWATFSANACEQVWTEEENGAALYLDITLASGTLVYRLAQ